jgi:hypothetical protein
MKRGCAVIMSILLLVASPSSSAADDVAACGGAGHPGIVLRAEGMDPELRAHVVEQLQVALGARHFELCSPERAAGALASLDVTPGGATGVSLTLSVRDEVTDKRVSRDIDLGGIPEDGRALAIAQAADELLRASWAELLVADAPKPKREVPPEITRALPVAEVSAPPPPPARSPMLEVAAAAAIEHFGSGHTQLGPDLSLGFFPIPRLGAVLRAGVRSAARAEATTGSVDPTSVAGALAVMAAAVPRNGPLGLDGGAELFVTRVHYAADALPGVRARSDSATAVHVAAVASGWAVLTPPLRATLGISLGAPIHTVRAVAADSTIAAISGVLLGAHLGLGGAW